LYSLSPYLPQFQQSAGDTLSSLSDTVTFCFPGSSLSNCLSSRDACFFHFSVSWTSWPLHWLVPHPFSVSYLAFLHSLYIFQLKQKRREWGSSYASQNSQSSSTHPAFRQKGGGVGGILCRPIWLRTTPVSSAWTGNLHLLHRDKKTKREIRKVLCCRGWGGNRN
jgi:hypothetical protein